METIRERKWNWLGLKARRKYPAKWRENEKPNARLCLKWGKVDDDPHQSMFEDFIVRALARAFSLLKNMKISENFIVTSFFSGRSKPQIFIALFSVFIAVIYSQIEFNPVVCRSRNTWDTVITKQNTFKSLIYLKIRRKNALSREPIRPQTGFKVSGVVRVGFKNRFAASIGLVCCCYNFSVSFEII